MKKLCIIISIFFIHTLAVHAAEVAIIAPKVIDTNRTFSVFVTISTDGNPINSMDIRLSYPKDVITFSGYKEDRSIRKIWLVSPKDSDGVIHFSGIIPGGVDGVYDPDKSGLQPIPLIELLFTPKSNGNANFTITHSDILQNNGKGSILPHENRNTFSIISIQEPITSENIDKNPPEQFVIQYIPSSLFSETPGMISFFATDTQSGVERYQVKTGSGIWKDVISPLATPKGILKREVIVRAIDFAGNNRESSVEIPGIVSLIQLLGTIIFCITCYFMFFVVKRKR